MGIKRDHSVFGPYFAVNHVSKMIYEEGKAELWGNMNRILNN